jgi:hypothetical protein
MRPKSAQTQLLLKRGGLVELSETDLRVKGKSHGTIFPVPFRLILDLDVSGQKSGRVSHAQSCRGGRGFVYTNEYHPCHHNSRKKISHCIVGEMDVLATKSQPTH